MASLEDKTRVLVVDDNPDFLKLSRKQLEKIDETLAVDVEISAKGGMRRVEEGGYDVVVADYKMPEIDGIEFLEALREGGNDIPFIILTGKGSEKVAMDALNMRANGYFRKGGNLKDQFGKLAHRIGEVIGKRQAEEARREAEEKYRTIFENAGTNVIIQNGKFREVNPKFVELTGYSEEELSGRKSLDVVPPEEREKVRENAIKMLKGQRSKPYEHGIISKDGEPRHVLEGTTSIPYEAGRATLVSFMDTTDRKVLEKEVRLERDRFEELFEGANEIIATTDQDGHFCRCNELFEEISGYPQEELEGESVLKVIHPEDYDKAINLWKEVLDGREPVREIRGLTKDGEIIHIRVGGRPITVNGEIVEIQYNAQDITDLLNVMKELEERNKELESFAYTVSHDLRSPLISLEGLSYILPEEFENELGEEGANYLDRIRANVEKMDMFIDDLLLFSRVTRRELPKEVVNVKSVIKEVLRDLSPKIEERKIKVDIGKNMPTFNFERQRLYQFFSNLISNACRYTGDQEEPRVEVGAKDEEGSWLLWVKDNGIGIDPEEQEKIFEIFHRAKGAKGDGTGVGLAIVERIVEAHGGEIWVESEKGEGSTFFVKFPKAKVE